MGGAGQKSPERAWESLLLNEINLAVGEIPYPCGNGTTVSSSIGISLYAWDIPPRPLGLLLCPTVSGGRDILHVD